MNDAISISKGGLDEPEVVALLQRHLSIMHAQTPPESVHALDLDGLREASVHFWTMRLEGVVVAVGALKDLGSGEGEVKSMHVASEHRRQGLAARFLEHLLAEAKALGLTKLSLETGSFEAFAPARALYARFGFKPCPPFGDYWDDPNSAFMTREI